MKKIEARVLNLATVQKEFPKALALLRKSLMDRHIEDAWGTSKEYLREIKDTLKEGKFALVNGTLAFWDTYPNRPSNPGPTVFENTGIYTDDVKTGNWKASPPTRGFYLILYALWDEDPQYDIEDLNDMEKGVAGATLDFTGVNMSDHNEAQCNEDTLGAHEQINKEDGK